MTTNRLSDKLAAALNVQMTNEAHASQIYLSLGAWASDSGYEGIANFLFRHANEERNHMMKIMEYILKRGAKAHITAIPGPLPEPKSLNECFEKVFRHETENTKEIYKIVSMSFEEGDWATWNFMQWMVREQTEEETLALDLLAKMTIAGGEHASGAALLELDKELEADPGEARLAETVTAANP